MPPDGAPSAMLLLVLLFVFLVCNVSVYGMLFFIFYGFSLALCYRLDAKWRKRVTIAIPVGILIVIMAATPFVINADRHRHRASLMAHDIPLTRPPEPIRDLVLLLDGNWQMQTSGRLMSGLDDWASLLLSGRVNSILVAKASFDALEGDEFAVEFEAIKSITRYRIEKRAWCPLVEGVGGRYAPSLAELARLARGDCIIQDAANLTDADAILQLRFRRSSSDVNPGTLADRLELWRLDGGSWRAVYRETHVGGTDLVPPLLFVPEWSLVRTDITLNHKARVNPKPIDVDPIMTTLGLRADLDAEPTEEEFREIVRVIMADPAIPRKSYQVQFLINYFLRGSWAGKDMSLLTAILQDDRVDSFLPDRQRETTPAALARPLAERMLRFGMQSLKDSPNAVNSSYRNNIGQTWNISRMIAQLPHCASLQAREPIMMAWKNEAWQAPVRAAKQRLDADEADKTCSG